MKMAICALLLFFDVLSSIYMVSRLSIKKGCFIAVLLDVAVMALMISGCTYIVVILLAVPAFVIYRETEKILQEEEEKKWE